MALTAQQVQQFYIGYYARPADPIGLAYWQTQDEASALAGFSGSAEFTAQFAGMSISQQVTKVYGNLLGRAPDATGLLYWAGEISAGRETIGTLVMSMITNALGKDVTTIADRVTYSTAFTAAINTVDEINAYAGTAATEAARAALLKVVSTAVGDHTALTAETAKIDATIAAIVSGGTDNPGGTFALTTGVDNFPGTAGNDTFVGGTAQIQAADTINGAGGTDTAKLYLDTAGAGLNASNVEIFQIQSSLGGGAAFNATNVTGAQEIWSAGSTTALTVTGLKNNVTLGLDKTQSALNVTFVAGAIGAAETLKLATDASGLATGRVTVTVNDGGAASKFTTLDVNAVAGKSFINIADLGGGANAANETVDFTTLKTSGAGTVDLAAAGGGNAAFNNLTTVELNAAGGSTVNLGANAKAVKVTGAAGNDTVQFAVTQFNTQDVIDLGAGTNTLVLGDANLAQAATVDLTKAINATKGVTTLATSAILDVAINAARYTAIDSFATTGAVTGTAGAAGASAANGSGNAGAVGTNAAALALAVSGLSASGESLQLQASVTGAAGGAGGAGDGVGNGGKGGNGTAALTLTMAVDSGDDSFTLSNAVGDVTIKGGAGGAGGAKGAGNGAVDGAVGTGAVGLNAGELETLNLNVSKNLTILDGAEAGAGSTFGTVDTLVGANAKINITGTGNVDLGLVGTNAGANFENFTIKAGGLIGSLRVATGAGNDVITVGSKGSVVAAGDGTDTITLGAGVDTVQFLAATNSGNVSGAPAAITTIDKVIGFQAGLGGDVLDWTTGNDTKAFFTLTSANRGAIANSADLKAAADAAANFVTTNNTWAAFEFGGKTYALYEVTGGNTTYDGSGLLVELTGVTATDLVGANFA